MSTPFSLHEDGSIIGLSEEGRATARLLRMNERERISIRHMLIQMRALEASE
jgi:hypothetical protein